MRLKRRLVATGVTAVLLCGAGIVVTIGGNGEAGPVARATISGWAAPTHRGPCLAYRRSQADDVFRGTRYRDLFHGGRGDDRAWGRRAADQLCGGRGRDELYGGRWRDELRGGSGNDTLMSGPSADLLIGGPGRDLCYHGVKDRTRGCESIAIP